MRFMNPSYQPHSHKPDLLTFKLLFLKKRNFQIRGDSQIPGDSKMTGMEQIITVVCGDDGFMRVYAVFCCGFDWARAGSRSGRWRDAYPVIETSAAVIVNATDLAADHGLTIWDSVVLAASAEAGCGLFLSEDLQEGFTWRGVTVVNPFAPTLHPVLAALLTALEA
jgi:hypothetical protein